MRQKSISELDLSNLKKIDASQKNEHKTTNKSTWLLDTEIHQSTTQNYFLWLNPHFAKTFRHEGLESVSNNQ